MLKSIGKDPKDLANFTASVF